MQRRALLSTISTALFMPMISRHASAAQAPGVTATEIKVGNTMPYSGPGSTYATQGKAEAAYFRMINEQGGVNGRTVNFISLDDQSSPSKALEQARRLIEQEEVALLFSTLGTQQNSAMVKYVNQKKVPHLFLTSGANKWGDYAEHPWTMGWAPSFRAEAKTYAKYIQRAKPDGKIGIIYENDDLGKDYVAGIRDVIGEAAMKNVSTVSFELTDATVSSQVFTLKQAGVDVLVTAGIGKFTALIIRDAANLAWKPIHIISKISASVGGVMIPAGPENATGIVSSTFLKDPTDLAWDGDPGVLGWHAFMAKYFPGGDLKDDNNVLGYAVPQTLVHVLMACGDDLSRDNIMRQASRLDHLSNPMLLPGITQSTSPTNYHPLSQLQMMRWTGRNWDRFGEIIEVENS